MKIKILVLMPLNRQQQIKFYSLAENMDFNFCYENHLDILRISEAEIIIGNPPSSMLKYAQNLKWLQLVTAGADAYQQEGLLDDHVILTSASGAYGEAQSEFMMASLLSLYKKLHLYRDNQNSCLWKDEGDERMLNDSTALIIGMGDIGNSFARRLKAFGVYVLGVRRTNLHNAGYADEIYSIDNLEKLLPKADIVSLTLPSTPATHHIINSRTISLMKPEAVLINTGRGSTVDMEALCDALERNLISGAALDVLEIEPLPPVHKLWQMRNVIITPHVAGHDFLPCTMEKTVKIVLSNLKAYQTGESLRNIVLH